MEFRRGNVNRARELFQEGVWADPDSRDVAYVWQVLDFFERMFLTVLQPCKHAPERHKLPSKGALCQAACVALPC